jgi:hypothetical protein
MLRSSALGALAFGAAAAITGYLWTAFEFPFAIVLAGVVGWLVVAWPVYGAKRAWIAAAVGGVSFTAAFLVGVFFALTDGSPLALPAWLAAALAAAIAGGLTGAVLQGRRGALALSGFSVVGMLVGVTLAAIARFVAPASVDVAGPTQYAYFAISIGLVGAAVGAAVGAGVSWLQQHGKHSATTSDATGGPSVAA